MIVGVSGAGGRIGRLVAETILAAEDLELGLLYDPPHAGEELAGGSIGDDAAAMENADVVVEVTHPDVVMENLDTWRQLDVHAVVGTSGFDKVRIGEVEDQWGAGPPNCLIVPNFSIGGVTAMRLAEAAAPFFAAAAEQHRDVESAELVAGARGADIAGVPVHAVRLPGVIADQMVFFGGVGETLTIRHTTTDRSVFMPGVLAAVRRAADLAEPVSVGLEAVLDL